MFEAFLSKLLEDGIKIEKDKANLLRNYWELLKLYNTTMHLFSRKQVEKELARQFYDIILLNVFLPKYKKLIDAGAGAGFAGIILSILNEESEHVLVERAKKKKTFLEMAILKLSLKNAVPIGGDISSLSFSADVVVSKASCMREILENRLSSYVRVGGFLVHFSAHKLPPPYKNYEFRNPFRSSSSYLSVLERVI